MTITHPPTLLTEIARATPGTTINYTGPHVELPPGGLTIRNVRDVVVATETPVVIGGGQLTLDNCQSLSFRNFAFRFNYKTPIDWVFTRAGGKVVTRDGVSAWAQNGRCVQIAESCDQLRFEGCSFGLGTDDLVSDYGGNTQFVSCLFGPGLLPGTKGSLHPNGASFEHCVWVGCEYRTPKLSGRVYMSHCAVTGNVKPCEWSGASGVVKYSFFAPDGMMLQRPIAMTSDPTHVRFDECTPRFPVGLPGRTRDDPANFTAPVGVINFLQLTRRELLDIIAHAGPAWSDPIDEYARRLARWHCGLEAR